MNTFGWTHLLIWLGADHSGVRAITAGTGFWSNTANQRSASLQEEHISEVRKLIGEHIEVAVELWEFCVARAHRANACVQSAFVLLTLGLVGLFSGPFVVILSRRIMIYLSVGSVVFLMASFTLIYAASLEYNNCVIERQIRYMNEREFALVSYKGRYFVPSLKPNYQSLIGLLIAYLFGFFPMTAIGLYLTIKASLGL
ncbi:unnamed protein product [Dicrocoelium dendriticum]|nr:unnamed protein product [Dicrocoelium dendriticum]